MDPLSPKHRLKSHFICIGILQLNSPRKIEMQSGPNDVYSPVIEWTSAMTAIKVVFGGRNKKQKKWMK